MASSTLKDIPQDASRRDQRWVDEALASGPEERFSWDKYEAAVKRGLERGKGKS